MFKNKLQYKEKYDIILIEHMFILSKKTTCYIFCRRNANDILKINEKRIDFVRGIIHCY